LEKAGFKRLREAESEWEGNFAQGGKYFFTRNQSSLVAFTVPKNFKPGAGVSIVATHTDSPNLRIRPVSKKTKEGYIQVGVETYGGGIWHSWFDRDLSIAGRVFVSSPSSSSVISKLVKIDRPILRIPTLAIHLDRSVNDAFKFNAETEMVPILGLVSENLNKTSEKKDDATVKSESLPNNHHPQLLSLLSEELSVVPDSIHDFELMLYDTQPATLGGINKEFIFSPRLDNLMSTFCAVEALCESVAEGAKSNSENVNCIALFNHEEIGSVSSTGAESSLLPSLLSRLAPTPAAHALSVSRSFLISADMGHAVHPNYSGRHEELHKPKINGGVIIKTNAKQRYTSDAWTSFIVRKLIESRGHKAQEFEVRNDMACGSTVGPMLSKMGLRVVDVGTAMLSMHSVREQAGTQDVKSYTDLFVAFFEEFTELDKKIEVE
jgi:aspartyl aminopeptidase